MNGIQSDGKSHGYEKSSPGCLGRMVNLFDLTSGVSGNRLLTDKPHNDGSSLSRSQSYVSAMPNFATNEIEDVMVSELRKSSSGKKPNGMPVKMLIAQEMSQDSESRQSSPNVVARLMGLDALPQQHSDLGFQNHSQFYSQKNHSENSIGYWQEEHGFSNKRIDCEVQTHQEQSGYTDMYELWQQSQRTNCRRDKSPQKGRTSENVNDKKLALIRQKFMEAKRLATDEKLRQTKEFQDALDVLSSNGDLFLKVLQETNSFISKNISGETFPPPPPPETKRITVLRPSKMVVDDKFTSPGKRNEMKMKNQPQVNHVNLWDNNHHGFSPTMSTWKANDTPAQPTRIVVLKPSSSKVNDVKAVVASSPSSPRILQREYSVEEQEDEEAQEAREVAKEITLRMRENLSGHRRDETLLSSVLSNGYTGDESSFDNAGNLSDSEVMSPISRHSWDYVNRYDSPCSSSFSRASCSPESSVCREAKKRLSERWAMMSSNGSHQEPRHVRRSSSTLGEMLALSEIKKSEICEEEEEEVRNNIDQDCRASTSCINSNTGVKESESGSPRSLSKSKSVPVSSTLFGEKLTSQVSHPVVLREGVGSKEATKTKASKSSFAGKVTSLFFSRNKKIRNEKSSNPQSGEFPQSASVDTLGTSTLPQRTSNDHLEVGVPPTSRLQSGFINWDLNDRRFGQGICSQQGGLYVSHPAPSREKHDEPSPISVLELPFEEDERVALDFIDPNPYGEAGEGKHISSCLSRSNLIDKSPPIGSIARTLSWDECSSETATNYPLNSPFISPGCEDNEAEWRLLVQSILTMAGLDHEGQSGPNLVRWHSPDSPLDPLLREKFIDLTAKEPFHEAKRRQIRSTRKLVFDCVNAALVDMGRLSGPHRGVSEGGLGDKVWGWMKEWFCEQVKLLSASLIIDEESGGDSNSLVERQVRKEVVGNAWEEQMRLEIDQIGKEIETNLIQDIVEDSLLQWNCE